MHVALFVAYLLFVHLGVVLSSPPLQWLALQALFLTVLLVPLRNKRVAAWLAWLAFAAATGAVARIGGGIYMLYLPPLALSGLACVAFLRSLRAGQTPLVTQVATAVHGALSPALTLHTRHVTQLWAIALCLIFVITLALTLSGEHEAWSLFSNAGTYVIMALLFAGEFAYRRWRFPDHDRDGFVGYLRRIARSGVRFR